MNTKTLKYSILLAMVLVVGVFGSVYAQGPNNPETSPAYGQDPAGLTALYRDHLDLVYREGAFRIDADLKSLGLASNRSMETLETLIELLSKPNQSTTARRLLTRYTNEMFATPEQWQSWLDENRNRIFFSDIGGYKFLVVPEGYLEWPE